jgi:hypothetical protein
MQRYPMDADAAFTQRRFERGRKMQTGGRRRHRALVGCEHGLIVIGVALVRRPF